MIKKKTVARRNPDGRKAHEAQEESGGITRRKSLKLLGGSAGVATLATAGTGTAAASSYTTSETYHDGAIYEDDQDKLELEQTTSLGHVGKEDYGTDYWYHKFEFSTTAGSEFRDEKADAIFYHEVTLDGDSPGWRVDFFEDLTGIKPTDKERAEVLENLETLAENAISVLDPYLGFGIAAMEGWYALQDMFNTETDSNYIQTRAYDRDKQSDINNHRTKHQGQFEVRVPKGESGWVTVESTTGAKCATCQSYSHTHIYATNTFELWVDDNDVSIYEYRY